MTDRLTHAGEVIATWLENEAAKRNDSTLETFHYRAAADGVRALVRRIAELETLLRQERWERND